MLKKKIPVRLQLLGINYLRKLNRLSNITRKMPQIMNIEIMIRHTKIVRSVGSKTFI